MENNQTVTIKLTFEKINKLKEFYADSVFPTRNENISSLIKLNNLTITVYNTNSVVFQGKSAEYEASIWQNENVNEIWKYNDDQIGSDEVGTGDYFGPICVCAAFLKKEDIDWVTKLGVDDSKKLTDSKILELAPILIKRIPYSQMSVTPEKYNHLISIGINQAKIKSMLHNQVLANLKNKLNKKNVFTVIDQFLSKNKYFEYVKDSEEIVEDVHFETKAESKYPCVAVASIIARYSFLIKMNALSKSINIKIPKGAGKEVDEVASQLVKDFGIDKLNNLVKVHFANTKRITE